MAWSKRRQGSAERFAVFAAWRNFVKMRWENDCRQTPAMLAGLTDHGWTIEEILDERIFLADVELPASWARYHERAVVTPAVGRNRTKVTKRAP